MCELERCLPAELNDDPMQMSARALDVDDLERILGRKRLEIEPIGGVVIGRDRFGIAVDHDGLITAVPERKGCMAAAIVELDSLADPVRSPAQDHNLLAIGGGGFTGGHWTEGRGIGGVHIGGW